MRRPGVQYRHGIDVPLTDARSTALVKPFTISKERITKASSPCRRNAGDPHVLRFAGAVRLVGGISDERARAHAAAPSRQGRGQRRSRLLRRNRPHGMRLLMDNGALMAAH